MQSRIDFKENGPPLSFRRFPVIKDVIFSLSFLVMITAPAFIVMRTDRGHHDL